VSCSTNFLCMFVSIDEDLFISCIWQVYEVNEGSCLHHLVVSSHLEMYPMLRSMKDSFHFCLEFIPCEWPCIFLSSCHTCLHHAMGVTFQIGMNQLHHSVLFNLFFYKWHFTKRQKLLSTMTAIRWHFCKHVTFYWRPSYLEEDPSMIDANPVVGCS